MKTEVLSHCASNIKLSVKSTVLCPTLNLFKEYKSMYAFRLFQVQETQSSSSPEKSESQCQIHNLKKNCSTH